MKRLLSLVLTVVLVITALTIPASAVSTGTLPSGLVWDADEASYVPFEGVVSNVYADINFNDAALDVSAYVTYTDGVPTVSVPANTYFPVATTNAAATDRVINIATKGPAKSNAGEELNASNAGTYYRPYVVADDDIAIAPSDRKKQSSARMTIDNADGTKAGIVPATGELVYFDVKVRRVSPTNDDYVTLSLTDSYGNVIATLGYTQNLYPQLQANVNYGGDAFSSSTPMTNYVNGNAWQYLRFVMNYDLHTFQLYVGNTMNELKPYISSIESYQMKAANAADFYKMEIGAKGSLGIDDIAIYTVAPPVAPTASNVVMTGKPNLGETLTATYGTYACEGDIAEGNSYAYWESADTALFVDATKITGNTPINAGQTSTYVLTANETGKYVRCVVVPVNSVGVEGAKAPSNATANKVNFFDVVLSVDGNIKNNTVWDLKWSNNPYAAKITYTSTLAELKNYTLFGAFYETVTEVDEVSGATKAYQKLLGVKALPLTVENASLTENGVITDTKTTETVYSIAQGTDASNLTMKVFLWNDLSDLVPASDYKYAGKNF
ncbi:MAG: hypothetical protein PHE51_07265 [Eubacteriales bacterium]|nr:hypothetical protein [Eubacteriales bacterium]